MKTFKDLKIGDGLYYLDELNGIKAFTVYGIIDDKLEHKYYSIYAIGSKEYSHTKESIYVNGSHVVFREKGGRWYSDLESLHIDRSMQKNEAINEQFKIALGAFRKIKHMSPNDDSLKKRIFNLFQINKEYEESS